MKALAQLQGRWALCQQPACSLGGSEFLDVTGWGKKLNFEASKACYDVPAAFELHVPVTCIWQQPSETGQLRA